MGTGSLKGVGVEEGGGQPVQITGQGGPAGGSVPIMLHFLFQAQVTLQLTVSLFACPLLLGAGGGQKSFIGSRTRSRRPNEELTAHVHIRLHGVFLD